MYFELFSVFGIVLISLNILISLGAFTILIFLLLNQRKTIEVVEKVIVQKGEKSHPLNKKVLLILNILSGLAILTIFFVPILSKEVDGKMSGIFLFNALGAGNKDVFTYFIFTIMFAFVFANIIYFLFSIPYFLYEEKKFVVKSKYTLYFNIAISLIFFVIGYFSSFYFNLTGTKATSISFIPFILMLFIGLGYSIFQGRYKIPQAEKESKEPKQKPYRLEPLVYVLILTLITFLSLFFNIIEITIEIGTISSDVKLTGMKLLSDYANLGSGFQILAFLLILFNFTSFVLLIVCLASYFAKYKDYYKLIKVSVFTNVIFMFLLGMSGIYYKISQKINEDNIKSLLDGFGISIPSSYTYDINSQTFYTFLISLVVLVIMIARKQLNHTLNPEPIELQDLLSSTNTSSAEKPSSAAVVSDFDACPVFTELDGKKPDFDSALLTRKENQFSTISLPELVRFIVDYARESRLHLSYSLNDIATFVAGLGASRLSILQGMSGTGKTSLPKIFLEAIMGNCEIVEVESSWRDKNELIGYYNEFSKTFTPKKFTQCLYKAKLNPEVTTFIVLDEMNLSRIEYYFSDFLSLMEHEEDKRKIKLLNVKLFNTVEGEALGYLELEEGHTLSIPTNVWFIGTANRDESTFEISDKVYDRAQTMNFNKRAPKIPAYNKEIPAKFLSYQQFSDLLVQAKQSGSFDAEANPLVQAVEKLLAPYNISFGNRILKQMEEFVKIYCACFGDPQAVLNEAVEKILLSKVVSKLESKNIEDKEELIQAFENLCLHECSSFVSKLNED